MVIWYRGHVNPANCPSFVDLVTSINATLHDSPKHSHICVVGVKWTPSSNLVVRAQAPSPSALVTALEAIQTALPGDHMVIKGIIPNTRWSHVTLSHVYTGKGPESPHYDSKTLHDELAQHNLAYAHLTIQQFPTWIHNPNTFKHGQISSISFAFEDPDGNTTRRLLGTPLTTFGNLRCSIKAWILKKPIPKE